MTVARLCWCGSEATKGRTCHAHKRRKPNGASRGYDAKWGAFSREYLRTRPMCEWEGGCSERATDVHHLDGLGPRGPRGFDPSNLQPLCHSHHSHVTATEQARR